jgi:hypothetical protein
MPNTVVSQSQWVPQNITLTFVDGDNFSTPGILTDAFAVGQRVKATVSAGDIYGTVSNSTAGGSPVVTTVTVTWDSGELDSGLSAVWTGILTPGNPSIPGGVTNNDLKILHDHATDIDEATATPTADTIAKFNSDGIMKGAELNMTGEFSQTSNTSTTTADTINVTAGDRILATFRCQINSASTGAPCNITAANDGTSSVQYGHNVSVSGAEGGLALDGVISAGGFGTLVMTVILKAVTSGTIVLTLSASTAGSSPTYTGNQIYGFFLKKAAAE